MTLTKKPAYRVRDLAERLGSEAVYEAIFSDLFEGKLTGKTYMLDYDQNNQDFAGNFTNNNEEPPDPFDEFLAIENPTREDYSNYRKANEEYWAKVVNLVPVLEAWTQEMFRSAFLGFADVSGVTQETPHSDIAKIPWERIGAIFKEAYIKGLYLSETGLDQWLARWGYENKPMGLKPAARVPEPRKRGRTVPGKLIKAAREAKNKIKSRPKSQRAGKTKISCIIKEIETSNPAALEKVLGGRKSDETIRRELGNRHTRPLWDI